MWNISLETANCCYFSSEDLIFTWIYVYKYMKRAYGTQRTL